MAACYANVINSPRRDAAHQRQLQQRAAGERLRVDRRHLRRDLRIDVLGSQIKGDLGDRRADHSHLAVGSPATRDWIRGFAIVSAVPFTVLAASSYHRGP
jgi:hypothetical protein